MAGEMQRFLAGATRKAVEDFIAAVEALPEDRRGWRPLDKGRSALNQAAELAILHGSSAKVLEQRAWDNELDFGEYEKVKEELARDWGAVKSLLLENTNRVAAAIEAFPDEECANEVESPWGPLSFTTVLGYAYWNTSYHEGQVNYISSIL